MIYRPGTIKVLALVLATGLLLGLTLAPMLWFGAVAHTSAQSLPFTPTAEPTELPPATATELPPATAIELPTQPPVVLVATPTMPPATAMPAATALPPGYGRDLCDPNHSLQQPCALATETNIANLSFNDAAVDVFSFLLKGGRQYQISAVVSQAGGIDPLVEVFLAGMAGAPIAANDDAQLGGASAVVTVTVQADAWYLVRVANQAPGSAAGKTYTLSARSVAAAASAAKTESTNPDDLIGNAYDPAHAARLAWNVPYDLSMICPDARAGACYAGRHSFLLVPVKANIPFTAITYDLGAGVDTVLTIYKPDPAQAQSGAGLLAGWVPVAENDDIAAGWTLRSQISFTPDWSSLALLVVAPSARAELPAIPADGRPGRYRLIAGGADLPNVKAALASQQDLPPPPATPTPRPTGQAAPAAVGAAAAAPDVREVIKEACPAGLALVGIEQTGLYAAAPPGRDDRIAAYPAGAPIKLLGQCYRGWVKVQPADSVTPGWMWAPDLRPGEPASAPISSPTGVPGPPATGLATAGANGSDRAPATPTAQLPVISLAPLTPLELPMAVQPKPSARAVTVEVCRAAKQGEGCGAPLAGLRVDLLLAASRQVLSGNLTDANGMVTLSVSVPAGSQLLLAIPALGLETLLGSNVTEAPVRVAGGSL